MRLSTTHLRILLVVANVLLAGGLLVEYAYGMWYPRGEELAVRIRDPGDFRFDDKARLVRPQNPMQQVAIVADWLQPKKVEPVAVTPPAEEKVEEAPEAGEGEEEYPEGGPLDEKGWEYVWGYFFHDDPLAATVTLRKKKPQTGVPNALRRSSGVGRRARIIRRTPTPAAGAGDTVTFKVRQREFEEKDLDLHFMIHAADPKRLVYWMPGRPEQKYALARVSESQYISSNGEVLKPPEDGQEEADDEQQSRWRVIDVGEWEDRREQDYQALLNRKPTSGVLRPEGGSRLIPAGQAAPATTPAGTPASGVRPTIRPSSATPAGSAEAQKSQEEKDAEAVQELRGMMNDPKIPAKDRQELQKAMKDLVGGKKRNVYRPK